MKKTLLACACALLTAVPAFAADPSVQVQPPDLHGSRALESQTATAVVRDYLESWQKFSAALDQNEASLLDPYFVGTSRDRLGATVDGQVKYGIHTRYTDTSHNLQIVFYSPEGTSIQMIDNVEYDQQVYDHDKLLTTQHIKTRYVVVLTSSAVRWAVRIFQAAPQA